MRGKKLDFAQFTYSQIRNFSIISHVDHGKTTLSDRLIAEGGLMPQKLAGKMRVLDNLPEEQDRGITINSSIVSFVIREGENRFLFNMIDTPGHVDFTGKVSESLRLVDNSLILVDAVEGVMAQTKTVLRQAIEQKLTLVLFINKIDRLINELQMSEREIRERIEVIIGTVENFCRKYEYSKAIPSFNNGKVSLGSALDGWAIDITTVKSGFEFRRIIDLYNKPSLDIPAEIQLSKLLTCQMTKEFLSPKQAMKHKFEHLSPKTPKRVLSGLKKLLILGGLFRDDNGEIGYICRSIKGSIDIDERLYSVLTGDIVEITQMYIFRGGKSYEFTSVPAGIIFGIKLTSTVPTGDLLHGLSIEIVDISSINYLQEAVVMMSIEPLDLQSLDKVEEAIQIEAALTPGLNYDVDSDTGQMIVSGVGTFQLDILVDILRRKGHSIRVSKPVSITYSIPLDSTKVSFENSGIITARVTRTVKSTDLKILYQDNEENKLLTAVEFRQDFIDGLIDAFKQFSKGHYTYQGRLHEFTLSILRSSLSQNHQTYEAGLISGTNLLKKGIQDIKIGLFQPHLNTKIEVPNEYLGKTINELQKLHGQIVDMHAIHDGTEIEVILPADIASDIADILRNVTDGHVFWSFPKVIYKRID